MREENTSVGGKTANDGEEKVKTDQEEIEQSEKSMNWPKFLFLFYLHLCGIWGLSLIFTQAKLLTTLFSFFLIAIGMIGTNAGCHRLWTHRTYIADDTLKWFLMICQTLVGQCSIYDWVVDHRVHHKYHGTPQDPYNYRRGFIYCQFKSHFSKQDDESLARLHKQIDVSDLEKDEVVMFQKKYYWILVVFITSIIPVMIPIRIWGETLYVSILVAVFFRMMILFEAAWLVNSASIVWGLDPLDRKSADTSLVFLVNKSLWPQYHYLLPWDYLSGEFGTYDSGCTTAFIKIAAVLGLAKGLTTISPQGVKSALADVVNQDKPLLECLENHKTVTKVPEILLS